ncbi:hypothetical protein V1282_002529 [Nitrobacteraceae bacterium AZCC 2146]
MNFIRLRRHQELRRTAAARFWGNQFVKTIRPNNSDPIPLRTTSPKMGTIIARFVGLLFVAVAILAWAWSR